MIIPKIFLLVYFMKIYYKINKMKIINKNNKQLNNNLIKVEYFMVLRTNKKI